MPKGNYPFQREIESDKKEITLISFGLYTSSWFGHYLSQIFSFDKIVTITLGNPSISFKNIKVINDL